MTWGISATIGNMDESVEVLMGPNGTDTSVIIKANCKKLVVEPVLPDEVETPPWAGHLGIRCRQSGALIHENKSTLIFTNTRAQAEICPANLGCGSRFSRHYSHAPQCHIQRVKGMGRGAVRRPAQGGSVYIFFGFGRRFSSSGLRSPDRFPQGREPVCSACVRSGTDQAKCQKFILCLRTAWSC